MTRHHLLFQRNSWESGIYTRKLRQTPNLVIPMFSEIEDELHKKVATVPLLDPHTAMHTNAMYHPARTHIASINGLMRCINEASQHAKATQLQKQLAELTIYAIEQQLVYIREGMLTDEVGHGISRVARR